MDNNKALIISAFVGTAGVIIGALIQTGPLNVTLTNTNKSIITENESLAEENNSLTKELSELQEKIDAIKKESTQSVTEEQTPETISETQCETETQSTTEASSQDIIDNKSGWIKDENGWRRYSNGNYIVSGWMLDNGSWYFFDENGYVQVGWVSLDNVNFYYCDPITGAMVTNQWTPDGYWVDESGLRQPSNGTGQSNENSYQATDVEKKVSIFTMDTFQGKGFWNSRSHTALSKNDFIDTYGNEYLSAYVSIHGPRTKDDFASPTYLLDNKYKQLRGKFAWAKSDKHIDGSIWVEFYSGDTLIYKTDSITATDRAVSFEFSVDGLETITIVKNGSNRVAAHAVYPYLDLIQ